METIWYLAFLVQYGAMMAVAALAGALVVMTVYGLVRNKVRNSFVGSASVQEPVSGNAL